MVITFFRGDLSGKSKYEIFLLYSNEIILRPRQLGRNEVTLRGRRALVRTVGSGRYCYIMTLTQQLLANLPASSAVVRPAIREISDRW